MKMTILTLLLGISVMSMSALADDSMASTNQTMLTGQDFVTQAAWAGEKEIALAQIALNKSQDSNVTNFAGKMIRDHTKANDRLIRIADKEGLSYPPTNSFSSDNWQQTDIENFKGMGAAALMQNNSGTNADMQEAKYLYSLSGDDFDREYAACAVADHTNAVQLFTEASQTLDDKQLKRFAKKTLPTLKDHYQMAVMLQNEVDTNSMSGMNMNSDTNSVHKTGGSGL